MLITKFVEHVEGDLGVFAELGGPDLGVTVAKVVTAARPALRSRFLEAVDGLVREFNDGGGFDLSLTLDGDHVRLARASSSAAELAPPVTNDLTARIALRVTDDMKQEFEESARRAGISMNSWIVRALDRALHAEAPRHVDPRQRRLRGVGQA